MPKDKKKIKEDKNLPPRDNILEGGNEEALAWIEAMKGNGEPIASYSKDSAGHEHKGKGPGGGQFMSSGNGSPEDKENAKYRTEVAKSIPALKSLMESHSTASRKLQSHIESLAHNLSGYSPDSKKVARNLSSEWAALHDSGASQAEIEPLESAMKSLGMEKLGNQNDPIDFDGSIHQGPAGSFTGDKHEISRPGWKHENYIPLKTKTSIPEKDHAKRIQSHIAKIGRANLSKYGLDSSVSALSDAVDGLKSVKTRQEAHSLLKATLQRVRAAKTEIKDKLKKSAKSFLSESFHDLTKETISQLTKALTTASIDTIGTPGEDAIESALSDIKSGDKREEIFDKLADGVEQIGWDVNSIKDADFYHSEVILDSDALENYPISWSDPEESDTAESLYEKYKKQSDNMLAPEDGEDAKKYDKRVQEWQSERQNILADKIISGWVDHLKG